MAGAAPRVGNVGLVQVSSNAQQTENLSGALKEVSRHLGKLLLDAFKLNRPANAPATPQVAQAPQAGAAAAVAGGQNPATPPVPFNSKQWLTDQCKQIADGLKEKTPAGKQNLRAIYDSARNLKSSLLENAENISNSLPGELRADFVANVGIIEAYFNGDVNTSKISRHEIRFLHAYVNFLKTYVGDGDADLNKSLSELSTALHSALEELTNDIQTAQDTVALRNNSAVELRTRANDAHRAADDAQRVFDNLPLAQQQDQSSRDTLDAAKNNATTTREQAEAAENELKFAIQAARTLIDLPEENMVRELTANATALNRKREALTNQLLEAIRTSAPPTVIEEARRQASECVAEINTNRAELRAVNVALHNARQNFIELQTNTRNLIAQNQTRQLTALLPEEADSNTHVLEQTRRQLKDIVNLSRANKHADASWLKHAQHFDAQIEALQANPQPATSILPEFENLPRPMNKVVNKQLANHTIYEHAVRIAQNNGNGEVFDTREKELALQVLGGFCAMQTNRLTDTAAYAKANIQMEAAGHLLAASLALKTAPAATLKKTLTTHAENFELKELHQILNTLPEDTPEADLRRIFQQGVTLNAAKTLENENTDVKSLITQGQTDRTYENDVTAMNGASRQTVFKEAMLRSVEILKNIPELEDAGHAGKSRMWKASNTSLDRTDSTILRLLGLNNDNGSKTSNDLLDQMVLASVAQNDLSINKDHVSRGSLISHINKYEQHPTRETLKNHNLHGFKFLSDLFTSTAIQIRPSVNTRIDEIRDRLTNNIPVSKLAIDQLVKQIIISTDAKAASNENFSLKKLTDTAEQLKKSNTETNRTAFNSVLTSVQLAWGASNNRQVLDSSQWVTKDNRSTMSRTLKANPVKSVPFINQTPVFGRLAAAAFNLAKGLIAATAGVAGGSVVVGAGAVAVAAVIGGAVVAAPLYGAYKAIQKTS